MVALTLFRALHKSEWMFFIYFITNIVVFAAAGCSYPKPQSPGYNHARIPNIFSLVRSHGSFNVYWFNDYEFHFTCIYFWFFRAFVFLFSLVFHIHFTWLLSICCFSRSLSLRFSIFLLLVVYSFFFGWCKKQPHNWIFVDDVIFVESDSIGNNFIGVNILLWMCY